MVSGLRLLWSPPLCPLRASAIFGPSIFSLPPPTSSGWPSASPGRPCSPPRSLLALPCVSGGWGFFCCSSSPIRSRGRFPVGLGSSNKMPCHTNHRPSHAIVQLHAAHHHELHCQASILARKRLRSSDKACAPHLLHSAAAHHSTAASWATVMDAHSEIPT